MTIASMQIRPGRRLASALLPLSIALALAACGGGGGGNVRPTPPPPTTPTGPGFTPTVDNDSSLTTLNPPAIPAQGVPVSLTDASINRHLSLTNALGALGAGLKGQGVTIGFVDSGVNRSHPTLTGRVTQSFIHVSSPPNDLSVDDKVGHGTVVASLAAGRPAPGLYSGGETGNWGGGIAQSASVVSSRIIGDARPDDDGSGKVTKSVRARATANSSRPSMPNWPTPARRSSTIRGAACTGTIPR
ncbi:MAG: S8 family serine peptidase [Thermomonas sp.]|uniref:S8 family serine peptidase n=1 Tax=Thermomonas sp. TaxID=1971895 RepID=UPI0025E072AB|nr:S8 family serine peptidase [Thermomonas sp.]MBK6924479.1 S8 family serine peptidase [Thermomonas sp.]